MSSNDNIIALHDALCALSVTLTNQCIEYLPLLLQVAKLRMFVRLTWRITLDGSKVQNNVSFTWLCHNLSINDISNMCNTILVK